MATVDIELGVNSSIRMTAETWQPTVITNAPFYLATDLTAYITAVDGYIASTVWPFIVAEKTRGATPSLQAGIRIENVTHPTVAKGVVKLPKAFREFQMTDLELTSAAVIATHIKSVVADLRSQVSY